MQQCIYSFTQGKLILFQRTDISDFFFFLLNWFPPKLIDNGSFISENVVSFAHKIFQCFFLDEKKLLRSLKRVKYRRDCIS